MPAKRKVKAAKNSDPVKNRSRMVGEALEEVEDMPDRVADILQSTLNVTVCKPKSDRHPFCDRMVEMIGEILDGRQKVLQKKVDEAQTKFDEIAPAKGTRETDLEQAQTQAHEKKDEFDKAKEAVSENMQKFKSAEVEAMLKKKAQETGDEEINKLAEKKAHLEKAQNDFLMPLLEGTVPKEERKEKIDAVLEAGKSFTCDPSLMQAVYQVLEKEKADRTGFDETCTEQIQSAFTTALQQVEDQMQAGAPQKAERAADVEAAEKTKTDAEALQKELKEKLDAAKEAKEAATKAVTAAKQKLSDFMPDMKSAGDALDDAKTELEEFVNSALASFNDLKDYKEGDFAPPPLAADGTVIDGMSCDQSIIDACRTAVAGQGDGRVSLNDAQQVFAKAADGSKDSQKERWTMRWCMQEFRWSDAAQDWAVEQLKAVHQEMLDNPAKKAKTEGSYYQVIDGFKCDRGIIDTCKECVDGQGDGRISRDDAAKVWAKAKDSGKVTDTEKWTLRFCFSVFNWTGAAHDWFSEQLQQEP